MERPNDSLAQTTMAASDTTISLRGVSEYRSFETNGDFREGETEDFELYRYGFEWRMVFKNSKRQYAPPQPTDLPPPDSPQTMMEILRTNRNARFQHKPITSDYGSVSEVANDGTNYYTVARSAHGQIRSGVEKTNLTEYKDSASIYRSGDKLPWRHGISLLLLFESACVTNSHAARGLGDITRVASSPNGVDYSYRIENDPMKNAFGPSALDIYLGKSTNDYKAPAATLVTEKSEIHNGSAIPKQAKLTAFDVLRRNADGTPIPLWSYAIHVEAAEVLSGRCQIVPTLDKPTLIQDLRDNSRYVSDSWPTSDRIPSEKVLGASLLKAAPPAGTESDLPDLKSGTVAPDFVSKGVARDDVNLSDWKGKIVVLDFWATWCGPCLASLPHTQSVAKRFKDQGVVLLATCTSDTRAHFESFVPAKQSTYSDIVFACDPHDRGAADYDERASHRLYGIKVIPTQFVIARDGKIASVIVGYRDGDHQLEDALAKLGVSSP